MKEIHDDHIHLRPHIKPPPAHNLAAVARQAEAMGIIPGIREHAPLPRDYRLGQYRDFEFAMIDSEMERFFDLFDEVKVPLGLEVDYLAGYESETEELLGEMLEEAARRGIEISGIHGSVHLIPGDIDDLGVDKGKVTDIIWDLNENIFVEHIKRHGPKKMIDDYFGRMRDLVRTGFYDTLSHIELIRKFDRKGASGESIYFDGVEDYYARNAESVLALVAETSMAVEINTAGVNNLCGRPYLSSHLAVLCAEMNIPVTIGSDAHLPEAIGAHLDIAREILKAAGISRAATFADRKIKMYEI